MAFQHSYHQREVNYSLPTAGVALKPASIHVHHCHHRPVPATFPLFPLLPPELRVRIWSLAAPHKRVVEIRSWGRRRYAPIKYSVHPHYLPAIFHVCRESRMEARRIYKRVGIGVSAMVREGGRKYVDWEYHPANRNGPRPIVLGITPVPYAKPLEPAYAYVSWEHDTIYLGPEFQTYHLLMFLTAKGEGRELEGLRSLAMDRKLWIGLDDGWGEVLRKSLWSLRTRKQLEEIIIVPDDEERCLVDRWYYGKHEIAMREPELGDIKPASEVGAQIILENLAGWFGRQWMSEKSGGNKNENEGGNTDHEKMEENEMVMDTETCMPPKVSVMSVRRNGQRMRDYTDGICEIQKSMDDVRIWKTWTRPASS